jgi:hypothetical protein
MKQDEIIEMAKKSNLLGVIDCFHYTGRQTWVEEATAFAKLVAAKEREACAKLADDIDPVWESVSKAIRARGEA